MASQLEAFAFLTRLGRPLPEASLSAADVSEREQALGIHFPDSYRAFIRRFGTFETSELTIYGLGVFPGCLPSVECAISTARALYSDFPRELIPFHLIADGVFACLDGRNGSTEPPVVRWLAPLPLEEQEWPKLADSFTAYLQGLVDEQHGNRRGQETLRQHVEAYQREYQYDHARGGKLPRNHVWRPYRYCIQDVVFGVTVVRHLREANCLEVDVFLTADIPEYGPLAGARALTHFLLSEAYKCGGTMEIRFTKEVEGGRVPHELTSLAASFGLSFARPDRLAPAEAKALYAALTGFSPSLSAAIETLEAAGRIKMARACYVVNHGVWSREQLELLVLGSERPDSILAGEALPQQRHLYYHDLLHARAALMTGMLERVLLQRGRVSESGVSFDMEDDTRQLSVTFDGQLYAKTYGSEEAVPIPWLHGVEAQREVPGGINFTVFVRAHDLADLTLNLETEIGHARAYREQASRPVFVLVPHDFLRLPTSMVDRLSQKAQDAQVGLMVCPEEAAFFDQDAAQRLARSRVLRQ